MDAQLIRDMELGKKLSALDHLWMATKDAIEDIKTRRKAGRDHSHRLLQLHSNLSAVLAADQAQRAKDDGQAYSGSGKGEGQLDLPLSLATK